MYGSRTGARADIRRMERPVDAENPVSREIMNIMAVFRAVNDALAQHAPMPPLSHPTYRGFHPAQEEDYYNIARALTEHGGRYPEILCAPVNAVADPNHPNMADVPMLLQYRAMLDEYWRIQSERQPSPDKPILTLEDLHRLAGYCL